MDNDSVVEQIVRSLSFEVEAVPQDNVIQLTTTTKSAPLNVKIRVRKKEEAGLKHGVLSLPKPDQPGSIPERVRLVSSDQTIMSFNVVMEADFQKPIKKPRKNILNIFKPTVCLGTQPDEDAYAYMPSKTYKAEINEESTSKSEGALTKFTLTKNVDNDETSSPSPKRNKYILGKCKPGGCLDPPFGEDRHPYSPANENEQTNISEHAAKGTEQAGANTKSKGRTSSTLSNKLFNWKRKSSNDDALDGNVMKQETKAAPVLDLYKAGSLQTSTTYSNSIMTYPPTLNSSELLQIQEKQRDSRLYNNVSKNSFNVHSGSYFIMPKNQKIGHDKSNNNKENYSEISDLKIDTINIIPEDKKSIAQHKDLEDDTKVLLETKNSVTNVRDTEEFSDLKSEKNSNPKSNDDVSSYDNQILLFKKPEEIGSKNISLEKDEGPNELQKQDGQIGSQSLNTASGNVKDGEKVNDDNDSKSADGLQQSESVTIKNNATQKENLLPERATDDHKPVSHEPSFEKHNETENLSQEPITVASNTGDKSVVTIDAKHEKSVYDITGVVKDSQNLKISLENEIKTSAEGLGNKFTIIATTNEIPTPIERDTPMEMIYMENDDLKQIWKNNTGPLISDSKFHTENELNKQTDKFNKKIDTLYELSRKETLDQISNISFNEEKNVLLKDNVNSDFLTAVPNEYDTEVKKENTVVDYLDSQSKENDLQGSIEQNASFEHSVPTTLDLIDSNVNQKLQDTSLEIQTPTTLISAQHEKNKDNKNFSHENSLEETTGLTQTKISPLNTIENSIDATEIVDTLKTDDGTNEFGQSKPNSEYIKEGEAYSEHGINKDNMVQDAIYDIIMTKQNAEKNKENNVKKITLHDAFKADSKRTEVALETTGPDSSILHEDGKSQTQPPEITSKNLARSIIANIAIQSYVDDNNQVIIKSFDADNVPKRYPHDTVRITKRVIKNDNKIQIPIDAENDLYIQIKSNKQTDVDDVHHIEKDKTEKSKATIKYDRELENIGKTLEVVYEKELLPLRNTIAELINNMESLKTNHMLLKSHMIVRKQRPTKIVPLYRRCVCMKK